MARHARTALGRAVHAASAVVLAVAIVLDLVRYEVTEASCARLRRLPTAG